MSSTLDMASHCANLLDTTFRAEWEAGHGADQLPECAGRQQVRRRPGYPGRRRVVSGRLPETSVPAVPALLAAVDPRAVVTQGLAVGAARLLLLVLAAAGFVAMHGVAATDPGGAHHDPMSVSATVEHSGPSATDHAEPDASVPMAMAPLLVTPGPDDGHGLMAACVFVLFSVLGGVALYALSGHLGASAPDPRRSLGDGDRRSRAPPKPIFLSLCVFRL
jgi:hypothetical protein